MPRARPRPSSAAPRGSPSSAAGTPPARPRSGSRGGALVTLLHRRADLRETMSDYLVRELERYGVAVRDRSEIAELHGHERPARGGHAERRRTPAVLVPVPLPRRAALHRVARRRGRARRRRLHPHRHRRRERRPARDQRAGGLCGRRCPRRLDQTMRHRRRRGSDGRAVRPRAHPPTTAGHESGCVNERVTTSSPRVLAEVGEKDHVLGPASPALTLVEYGDFGCRFCYAANRPVLSLLDRFDRLRLVWRHLPDPELHPGADLAAELSELAASYGKFWEAHALLLTGRESFSRQDLFAVAEQVGLRKTRRKRSLRSADSASTFSPISKAVAGPEPVEPRPSSSTAIDLRARGASSRASFRQGSKARARVPSGYQIERKSGQLQVTQRCSVGTNALQATDPADLITRRSRVRIPPPLCRL